MNRSTLRFARLFTSEDDGTAGAGGGTPLEGDTTTTDDENGDDGDDGGEEDPEPSELDTGKLLASVRKKNSENKALRARAKDAEDKAKAAEGDAKRVPELEAQVLRLQVALDNGIPAELAGRLRGSTKEELLEDAEQLLGLFERRPPTRKPQEKRGGTQGQERSREDANDLDKIAADMFRN